MATHRITDKAFELSDAQFNWIRLLTSDEFALLAPKVKDGFRAAKARQVKKAMRTAARSAKAR